MGKLKAREAKKLHGDQQPIGDKEAVPAGMLLLQSTSLWRKDAIMLGLNPLFQFKESLYFYCYCLFFPSQGLFEPEDG